MGRRDTIIYKVRWTLWILYQPITAWYNMHAA